MIVLLKGYGRTKREQREAQILRKFDRNHLDIEQLLRNAEYLAKKSSPSATRFPASERIKDALPLFTRDVGE